MTRRADELARTSPISFYEGRGKLYFNQNAINISYFEARGEPFDPTASWHFKLIIKCGEVADADRHFQEADDFPSFEGTTFSGYTVRADQLRWRHSECIIRAYADRLEVTSGYPPAVPHEQTIFFALSPTPLAPSLRGPRLRSWTGEIEGLGDREPLLIPSTVGLLSFALGYHYDETEFPGGQATLQLPVPRLYRTLGKSQKRKSISQLMERLIEDVTPILRALSFLSRRNVGWRSLGVLHSGTDAGGNPYAGETTVWNAVPYIDPPQILEQLVAPGRLGRHDLGKIVQNLRNKPRSHSIQRAIPFLNAGFGKGLLDSRFINVFTSLEVLHNGYWGEKSEEGIFSGSDFDKLKHTLKGDIKAFMLPRDYSASSRSAVYRKLQELNRRPFVDGILEMILQVEIRTDDLLPPGVNLREALEGAYTRRNALVHDARLEDKSAVLGDLVRLHAIAERIIYRDVGARDVWLHPLAYRHCRLCR